MAGKQNPIRVALGGGNPIDRAGLAALLDRQFGFEVVAIDAYPLPKVLVWDASADLASLPQPLPGIFLLVMIPKDEIGVFPDGVSGLFSKDETPEALGIAIRQVERGQQYISPSLAIAILIRQGQKENQSAVDRIQMLSDREQEILNLLVQGLSNKAIAAGLYLSVRTVEGHLDKLYTRLGVHSRAEAMLLALKLSKDR